MIDRDQLREALERMDRFETHSAYDEVIQAARKVLDPITDEEVEAARLDYPGFLASEVRQILEAFMRERFE